MGVKMDLYRSEDMELVQLIIPAESAHDTVTYVGELGLIQFKDLNSDKSPFQRTFAAQVKRCGEMERKLRFFKDQIVKAGLHPAARSVSETDVNLDELEVKLADLESELLEINSNSEKLTRTHSELNELRLVLQQAGAFFTSARSTATAAQRELDSASPASGDEIDSPLLEQEMQTEPSKPVRLGFIAGVVPTEKSLPFERILFRATRGNMFLKLAPIQDSIVDPVTGEKIAKSVFVVFFAGERARTKISKIADVFAANCYPFPDDVPSQRKLLQDVAARLEDLQTTIDASIYHRDSVLTTIGYQLEQWISLVRREKAVFHVLNLLSMDVTKKCLVGEGWCPVASKAKIQDALQRAAFDSNSQVGTIFQVLHTKEEPPTYFITNKFTNSYQEIVDAYGIAKYKEVNPGVFTIISFPFLFAVMFGDWGHGIVLFLASLYLILNEKKYLQSKLSDMVEMTFGGRYVILLMSIFSMYTGLIYNEFFSVPFEIFGKTAYSCTVSEEYCSKEGFQKVGRTYPFGIDPIWHGTRSELPFLNSVKMKMSILLGVAQMTLGIFLSLSNARFFKNYLNIWYEVVPQLLFLGSLFGYLCVLIIIKWVSGSQADLYHVMIYMFLSPLEDPGENQLFWGQRGVQVVLLLIALVAVPWMLLPKPLILRNRHMKKVQNRRYEALRESDTDDIHDDDHNEHDEFEFSEVFVHQMIHTIEFVLGAVSNTASYLRLWALSLAHSQLSSVFYEKVLLTALSYSNPVFWVIGFLVFVMATVGVLLVMETLSAFLHALRLHWVEFQNKFFAGDGYKFQPFSFKTVAEDEI